MAGMARLQQVERRIVRRSRSGWWRFWWRVCAWLFGASALVAICAAVLCIAADRTERVKGRGLYSVQALEIIP